jgi:membrane fusion protein (multidrug efflux system)
MKKISSYLVLPILGFLIVTSCSTDTTDSDVEKTFLPLVKLEQAVTKTFVHKIVAQGNVETDKDVILNSEIGGIITQIHVEAGQHVNAGQILITLDASMLSANKKEIQSQLEYAEYMLNKQEELNRRGVGSEFDYETAKNQVNSLRTRINSLDTQRGKYVIKAPFSGVVDQVFAKDGELAGPQSALIRIVNNSVIDITSDLSEKYFSSIHLGTPIEVTFPNYNDTIIYLKVTNVGNFIEPTNRTFRIMATIQNNRIFLPNMLAELFITDVMEKNALVIPSKSIMKGQDNSDYIYVAKKDTSNTYTIKRVPIQILKAYDGETMIERAGTINESDLIVVEGARGITEKDIVRIN